MEIKPDYAEAYNNLRSALADVIRSYRKVLQVKPDDVVAANNLAWLLATCPVASLRDGAKAVKLAQRAVQLSGEREPAILGTLAAAYAEADHFPEAVQTARKALKLATQENDSALADDLRARIALYEAGNPFRQTLSVSPPPRPKP